MSVKIRLSRIGKTNHPFWRVVAMDSRKKRDGAALANLGTYDPVANKVVTLNVDGINEWVAKGAQCSDTVKKLVRMHKRSAA